MPPGFGKNWPLGNTTVTWRPDWPMLRVMIAPPQRPWTCYVGIVWSRHLLKRGCVPQCHGCRHHATRSFHHLPVAYFETVLSCWPSALDPFASLSCSHTSPCPCMLCSLGRLRDHTAFRMCRTLSCRNHPPAAFSPVLPSACGPGAFDRAVLERAPA